MHAHVTDGLLQVWLASGSHRVGTQFRNRRRTSHVFVRPDNLRCNFLSGRGCRAFNVRFSIRRARWRCSNIVLSFTSKWRRYWTGDDGMLDVFSKGPEPMLISSSGPIYLSTWTSDYLQEYSNFTKWLRAIHKPDKITEHISFNILLNSKQIREIHTYYWNNFSLL